MASGGEIQATDYKKLNDLDMGPYWDAKRIEKALCNIPGKDAKHVIGKCGRTLQRLQALSGMLFGVVDQSNVTPLVQIYSHHKGRNIVWHFLSCLQEEFHGVLGALERALGDLGQGLTGVGMVLH